MKNMKKKVATIFLVLICACSIGTLVYAFDLGTVTENAFSFETKAINNAGGKLDFVEGLTVAGQMVGTVIAVIVGILLAIKYMTNGAMGKADIKSSLTAYCIGVVMLYSVFGIWATAVDILQQGNTARSSSTVGRIYIPGSSQVMRTYQSRPTQSDKLEGTEVYDYDNRSVEGVFGAGTLVATGIKWDEMMSDDDQVFLQNVIDSVEDPTIKDVITWARDRIGFRYEREDDATRWVGSRTHGWSGAYGTNWDRYLELPDYPRITESCYSGTDRIHCGFDCSSFVSRAYYAVTALIPGEEKREDLFPTVPNWPYCCTTFYSTGRPYVEDIGARVDGIMWSYNHYFKLIDLKDYLKPGDMIFSPDATHIMLFVGFNGDTPQIIHSGGSRGATGSGVVFDSRNTCAGILRPIPKYISVDDEESL